MLFIAICLLIIIDFLKAFHCKTCLRFLKKVRRNTVKLESRSHLGGKERAGCFAWFVFLVSRGCCVALPLGAVGLSAVCDCDVSWSYALFRFSQ